MHCAARSQASIVLGLDSGLLPQGHFKQAGFAAVNIADVNSSRQSSIIRRICETADAGEASDTAGRADPSGEKLSESEGGCDAMHDKKVKMRGFFSKLRTNK